MTKQINIAIDGHSSCGKGTLAKYLANALNYTFIDTGAMYRAVTYAIAHENIDVNDIDNIKTILAADLFKFDYDIKTQKFKISYKGEDISQAIRMPAVSNNVSQVSKIAEVRTYLVQLQRKMATNGGVVMDGRDIGTNVLVDAELKIFMTADAKTRAMRRYEELKSQEVDIDFEQVYENILFRDKTDSGRSLNPLIIAENAKVIDNTKLSKEDQNALALKWAMALLETPEC